MILDERTEFFDSILIPQSAGTALLGDVVDTSVVRDLGNGQPIYWYVSLDVAGAGGTSAEFRLCTADNAALTTNLTVHQTTGTIALASLTPAGKMLYFGTVPLEGVAYRRYLGVSAVVVGTFTGTGAVSSGLTLDAHGWKAYAEGQN